MSSSRKTVTTFAIMLPLGLGTFAGCESTARPREVDESRSITSQNLDIQNFNGAAKALTEQMLASPRVQQELDRIYAATGRRPLVKVDRVRNDTGLKINMIDYVVAPIEEVLTNSGKVDFVSEDSISHDQAAQAELLRGSQPRLPDLVLYGVVSKLATGAGDTNQNAFTFQMRLADANSNTNFFVGSKQIIKQVGRSAFSF
ncbi:MAG: hypothetical protein NZ561_00760 [Phycisphaerae bacterium]|nr:hypothetical protein [Phycisphaerae bacterium]MDW8263084.1 hypothetical protein [Phycisphaerales bacterium]